MSIQLSKPIIFVGPPYGGKSTVGSMVASRLGVSFYDLDPMIETQYRISIQRVFASKQEPYFRLLETQCLGSFCKRPKPVRYVIATGGGVMESQKNRDLMQGLGDLVYLRVSAEQIVERMRASELKHPVLHGKSCDDIRMLLKAREKYYMTASRIIETSQHSSHQVCLDILGGLRDGTWR